VGVAVLAWRDDPDGDLEWRDLAAQQYQIFLLSEPNAT